MFFKDLDGADFIVNPSAITLITDIREKSYLVHVGERKIYAVFKSERKRDDSLHSINEFWNK